MASVHRTRPGPDDSTASVSTLDQDNMLDVPITDAESVSSSATLGGSSVVGSTARFHPSPQQRCGQPRGKPYFSSPASPVQTGQLGQPGQPQSGRGLGIRISSRPSDLVLSAMNQRNTGTARRASGSTTSSDEGSSADKVRPSSTESTDSFPDPADTSLSSLTSVHSQPSQQQPPQSQPPNCASRLRQAAHRDSTGSTSSSTGSGSGSGSGSDNLATAATAGASASAAGCATQTTLPLSRTQTPRSQMRPHPAYLSSQSSFVSSTGSSERVASARSMPVLPGVNSQSTIVSNDSVLTFGVKRRSQHKRLSKAEKNKLFEDDDGEVDENMSAMYNVPVATSSTASLFSCTGNRQSQTILRKAWGDAPSNVLAPSPLPGSLGESSSSNRGSMFSEGSLTHSPALSTASSVSNTNPATSVSPMAKQLSNFYEYSLQSHADEEFERRSKQAERKGIDQLSLEGLQLDESKMISQEKLEMLTPTRPVWLPPKDQFEASKQEHEFRRMINHEGHKQKKEHRQREKRERERMIGDARLAYLAGKDALSSTNVGEVKRLMWFTKVDADVRLALFARVLKYQYSIPTDEQLNKLPPSMIANNTSLDAVNTMVESIMHSYSNKKMMGPLTALLKRTTPMTKWTMNTCKVALSLLDGGFNNIQALRTLHYLNDFVITDKFVRKFNDNITSNRVMASYGKHFEDDLNATNMPNFVRLLNCFAPSIIFNLVNLLVVLGDYKFLYAFLLTILLNYHFGWNNVQLLLSRRRESLIRVDDESVLWSRVYAMYKKF